MKKIVLLTIGGIVLAAMFFTLNSVSAQDITFEASVDKNRLSFEDVLVLSFVLSGSNIDMNAVLELPDMKDSFDILRGPSRSQNISIINGRQSSSLTIQYVLSPKKTGTLEIGAATIVQNKKTYGTTPISIEVLTVSTPSQQGVQGPQNAQGNDTQPDVFLRAEVDKETAYLGEQITISYKLYTRLNISGYEISQQPSFTGFWLEELQVPAPPKLQMTNINGQQYGVALMKKVALFPTSSGHMTIDPLVMTFAIKTRSGRHDPFDMFGDSFFGRTEQLIRKTQPLSLTIQPLPEENRPGSFNGDVGAFTMSVEAEPKEVLQDEPVTLRIKIQGTGNIKTVKEPLITLPESFKRYDTQISEAPFTLQEPLQGEKVFETVIIPSSDGTFQVPPVLFSYFDPQRASYQTLRSQPLSLVVLPKVDQEEPMERRIATKEEIKLIGKDIRFIKTDVNNLEEHGRYWHQSGLFQGSLLLPIVCVAAAWGYKRHRKKYACDTRYLRRKQANKLSKQRLKDARALLDHGDAKAFYAAISNALRQYLGDKLNVPSAAIVGYEAGKILREHGLNEEVVQRLIRCLDTCDYARFAPVGADRDEMQRTLQEVEVIIREIEGLKGLGGRSKPSVASVTGLVLCAVFALSIASQGAGISVEEIFRQGNEFYEGGQYQEAIDRYQQILATGLENGYVYYNIGNALLKEQRVGEAILQYERAQRLLPRDEDINFNLGYAKALTLDKMEGERGTVSRMVSSIRTFFSPNELSLAFWLAYAALTMIVIAFMFVPRRWKIRMVYLALPCALLLMVSAILLLFHISYDEIDEAIVLAEKIEAKTGPGESYSTLFEIHEGAKVRIQREKLDWVEIKLPNKVIGWIPNAHLERIAQQIEKNAN